jgi:hypothetical protein
MFFIPRYPIFANATANFVAGIISRVTYSPFFIGIFMILDQKLVCRNRSWISNMSSTKPISFSDSVLPSFESSSLPTYVYNVYELVRR